jgi:hypothetical protein
MADSLSTIGSIATFITSSFANIPTGVSGNTILFVDLARQYVSQYTGVSIGSNSIPENYQSVIVNLSMSNVINSIVSQGYASLSELSINGGQIPMSASGYKEMAEMQLKVMGRYVGFARSLS